MRCIGRANAKRRPPQRAHRRGPLHHKRKSLNGLWIAHIPTSTKHAPSNHTLFGIPPYKVFVRVTPGDPTYDRVCRQKGESPKRECRYTQPWPLVPIGTCIEVPLEHAHKFQSMPLPDGFGLAEVLVQNQPGPQGLSRPAQGCSRRVIVPCLWSARPAGQDGENHLVKGYRCSLTLPVRVSITPPKRHAALSLNSAPSVERTVRALSSRRKALQRD